MALKVVFAGTPEFAIPSLKALIEAKHEVCAVYTKADSPSGRGLKMTYSPVKQFVLDHYPNLPLLQPPNLKDANTQKQLNDFFADIMVVIAYGLILPKPILSLFKYGCINVHASLLPRWRGAAPIQRALLAGDEVTGVTIMQINEGLDTGDMLQHQEYKVSETDNARTVHDSLAELGAKALLTALKNIEAGTAKSEVQNNNLATYAAKITRDEALINWHEPATKIERQIRAFNPWPIAYTYLSGQLLKIWEAKILTFAQVQEVAGRVTHASEAGIDVATPAGVIRLLTIQIPGGKPMSVGQFLNARSNLVIPKETILGETFVGNT